MKDSSITIRLPYILLISLLFASFILTGCGGGGGNSSSPVPEPPPPPGVGPAICTDGLADGYPCSGISLRKRVTLATMGGTRGSDIWGWHDSTTNDEYALMGMNTGTAFVRVTDPENPLFLGELKANTTASSWRDMKVFQNHAYIVSDNAGNHGMQIFDLTRLRGLMVSQAFSADAVYGDIGSAHNVFINADSQFAYIVGSNTCLGGLHIADLSDPINPLFNTCHSANGYTHDTQCVNYAGPDADYAGAEICFSSNEDHVAIVDVTTKGGGTSTISTFTYTNVGYVHQNWLSEDHQYLVVTDELDEIDFNLSSRVRIFDVRDLDAPQLLDIVIGRSNAIDHNVIVHNDKIYKSNYTAGLELVQVIAWNPLDLGVLKYFDSRPEDNSVDFEGAWGVYPFLPSGNILLSDRQRGLFILKED